MILWPCLLFLPLVCFSAKITPEENAEVKKICGATNLDDGEQSKLNFDFQNFLRHLRLSMGDHLVRGKLRIQGGIPIRKNQYPWIAALHRGGGHKCTGSLISNRHILTAAHCVVQINDPNVPPAEKCRRRGPLLEGNWTIFVGSGCTNPEKCDEGWLKPDQIYFHEDFNECTKVNDIAIFEFKNDIPRSKGTPICMPDEKSSVSHTLKVGGSGITGPSASTEGYKTIDVDFIGTEGNSIKVKASPEQGICPGDSGGPLFQTGGQKRNVQIGIASNGASCLPSSKSKDIDPATDMRKVMNIICVESGICPRVDYATDVRKYLDWICEKTGVCPMDEDNKSAIHRKST